MKKTTTTRAGTARGFVHHRPSGLYQGRAHVSGKRHSLGYYSTPGEASAAHRGASKMLPLVRTLQTKVRELEQALEVSRKASQAAP